jgi:hypothetical protein
MSRLSRDRAGIIGAIIAVVVIVVVILVILALVFIPFRTSTVDEGREAKLPSGVSALDLNLTVDAGMVYVKFVDTSTNAVALTVKGQQHSGIFGSNQPSITWKENSSGDNLTVSGRVDLGNVGLFTARDINCTLTLAKQLRTSLTLTNSKGSIFVDTSSGVNLAYANLKTSTGGARVQMVNNTTLSGPLTMDASLGGVELIWNNAQATPNASINLKASTGGVRAVITQTSDLGTNMTLKSAASLGGVELSLTLGGDNSAHVVSHANTGGVSVQQKSGFNGTDGDLVSTNYPGASNFEVSNSANTGGVSLRVIYSG